MSIIYQEDKQWKHAKDVSRSAGHDNNWVEVVSFYNEIGGRHTQVFTILNKESKRIILVLDDDNVLVKGRNGDIEVVDYTKALEGNKTFYYQEYPKEEVIPIPDEYKLEGNSITIYS